MANGDFDFTAGQILTAAQVDDYLMLQAVQKFATSAARDAALTSRKREGMVTYQDDVNSLTVYSGSAWSTIGSVSGALPAFTPVVTQSGSVTLTVNNSTWSRVGRQITWRFTLSMTGSGTAANLITVSLPVNINYVSDYAPCGNGQIYDTSVTTLYQGFIVPASASTIKISTVSSGNTGAAPAFWGVSGVAGGLASGDIISGFCTYEAAADA